jgi:hypothetical protein
MHSYKRSLEKPKRPLQVFKSSDFYCKTVLNTMQVFKYDVLKNGMGGVGGSTMLIMLIVTCACRVACPLPQSWLERGIFERKQASRPVPLVQPNHTVKR